MYIYVHIHMHMYTEGERETEREREREKKKQKQKGDEVLRVSRIYTDTYIHVLNTCMHAHPLLRHALMHILPIPTAYAHFAHKSMAVATNIK